MSSTFRTFEDLKCWQACRELRVFISRQVVPKLPVEEKFLLRSQILDASRSTSANIAEGYGRFHYMDNAKFCSNSRGSAYETLDHLITAFDDGYIDQDVLKMGRKLVSDAVMLTNGYIRHLKQRKNGECSINESSEEYFVGTGDNYEIEIKE